MDCADARKDEAVQNIIIINILVPAPPEDGLEAQDQVQVRPQKLQPGEAEAGAQRGASRCWRSPQKSPGLQAAIPPGPFHSALCDADTGEARSKQPRASIGPEVL